MYIICNNTDFVELSYIYTHINEILQNLNKIKICTKHILTLSSIGIDIITYNMTIIHILSHT